MLLGDPGGSNIFVEGVSASVISLAENISQTPQQLAVNLLTSLFSAAELATGNCTKAVR